VRVSSCLRASPFAIPRILAGVALAGSPAPTPPPSNVGDTWVPTFSPTCTPEIVTYTASHTGFLAWLNHKLSGLCSHTLQVTLSSGKVQLGNAQLDALPPGLHLVLQGSGRSGAGATMLDFDLRDRVELHGTDVRIEFRNIDFVKVRCAAILPWLGSARLGSAAPIAMQPPAFLWSRLRLFATVGDRK
jgi:hypothetical protein